MYDRAMRIALEAGMLEYCGVCGRRVGLRYGAIAVADHAPQILAHTPGLTVEF